MQKSDIENIKAFQKKIKIEFKNQDFLKKALTHRSFVNESKTVDENNERLEFLGDAVLELITTKHLFDTYPDRTEGDLTSFRAALVRTESLAESALDFDLGEYLFMSKGEEATGGRKRPYILANAFEALLGAIYKDQGFEPAEEFVHKHLIPKLEKIVKYRLDIDNKSKLQELAQEQLKITPNYELIGERGPDHQKEFNMAVFIGEVKFGEGWGGNKQEGAQNAAGQALENWDKLYKKYKDSFDN